MRTLDKISQAVSPISNIATKWQFWVGVAVIVSMAFMGFILYPAVKIALLWTGRLIGTFMGGG